MGTGATGPAAVRAVGHAVLDAYSRLVMGWALSLYPSSAHVLAAMRAGIAVERPFA